jgi:hypothetical protein
VVPIVDFSFSEGSGTTTTNRGTRGGLASFATQGGYPMFAANAPVGPYAPAFNSSAVDFGAIVASSDGNRAVDLPGALGPINGFTVCGWVNCRDLTVGWGGNRLVFALVAPNGSGFDLVHLANGSLQLGVNQWPDGSPAVSSGGRLTADPSTGPANWVFFAVTYDGTRASDNVKFYFGNGDTPAALDVTRTYSRGVLPNTGAVTLGNFGPVAGARTELGPGGGSRVLRGLLDQVMVFTNVLTLEEIQAAQVKAAQPPAPLVFLAEPVSQTAYAGQEAVFSVAVSGGMPIWYQWQRNGENIPGATNATYVLNPVRAEDNGAQFRVVVSNLVSVLVSSNATLGVQSDLVAPWVVSVVAPSLTNILITFSEPLDPGMAQEVGNYMVQPGNLGIWTAVLAANQSNVLLTTDLMITGAVYTLTVQAIADRALPFPNFLIETNVTFTAYMPPPRGVPVVEVRFEEGSGNTVTNSGRAGGVGLIDYGMASSLPGLPTFTNNVPLGPYAPAGNFYALYTGAGSAHSNYAGKAVDFPYAVKTNTVGVSQFTVTGWINATDGTIGGGGNRIISTWPSDANNVASNRLTGFDVVMESNGRLRLGVNQAPDYPNPPGNIGPTSSSGRVPWDANGSPGNWVFFAITYDASLPSENVKFYFGNGTTLAARDTGATLVNYNRGPVLDASVPRELTLGNFVAGASNDAGTRDSTSNSRAFRGLMDEIRFFAEALTEEEIRQVQVWGGQTVPTAPPGLVSQPVSQTVFAGQPAAFSVIATGTPPLNVRWLRNGEVIPSATNFTYAFVAAPADDGAVFRAEVYNNYGTNLSEMARLTVLPEDGGKVWLAFEEGNGTWTTNLGNLGGRGEFTQQGGFPQFSASVPVGVYAPASNAMALDFGTLGATDGNRAVDLVHGFGNSLGRMESFTVCGWLNCRDLTVGGGGNRIVFALESPNGRGFDLVHLADGSLQLGVNQWPDGTPARSSAGRLTADPQAGPQNWVFFAVTYDPGLDAGQAKFFFGTPSVAATLDQATDYQRGRIEATGQVTLGNFGAVAGTVRAATGPANSRCFRGLMDEIKVFNRALNLQEIQYVQVGLPPNFIVTAPWLGLGRQGGQLIFNWTSPVPFRLFYTDDLGNGNWQPVEAPVEVQGGQSTVRLNADQPLRFFRLQP